MARSSPPQVFLEKCVLKICSKFRGEHPFQSVISIKLQSNFTEITLRHGCSPLHLLHTVKPPNSWHPKQRTCLEQRTKCLVTNVTIFVKLPPNSGCLLITGKFFTTRRCPLFRGFTLFSEQLFSRNLQLSKITSTSTIVLATKIYSLIRFPPFSVQTTTIFFLLFFLYLICYQKLQMQI